MTFAVAGLQVHRQAGRFGPGRFRVPISVPGLSCKGYIRRGHRELQQSVGGDGYVYQGRAGLPIVELSAVGDDGDDLSGFRGCRFRLAADDGQCVTLGAVDG